MNNQTYTTKNSVKQNISACGRSSQSRIKMIAQCKVFALYQKEQPRGVLLNSCHKQLKVTARASAECDSVMFVS